MERLRNMELKKSFLVLSVFCIFLSLLLLRLVFVTCDALSAFYPAGGIEIMSDGSVVILEEPSASQQRVLTVLNMLQVISCIVIPVGGLIISAVLFYGIKLKQPIMVLRDGIARIQNNDLDFTLPVLSEDELGRLCGAFETMRKELLKTNRLLWQQAEERKRLNAAFSHDLRNPVTVLKGTAALLRQGVQDERTIDRLESYTLRIEQYIEAMSSVQRLEQLSVQPKEIDVTLLREELQETARLLAPSENISISAPSEGSVFLDHGIFLTAAENLIGNAARFAKKEVSVQMILQGNTLSLIVSDDGPGYPPELLKNGPGPFETAGSASGHFGMGLYSSRLLCTRHGGDLILKNKSAGGASAEAVFQLFAKP